MTLTNVIAALERALPGQVERAASSAARTTYRCGGALAALVRADTEADIAKIAAMVPASTPVLVIGRGSNLLVADTGFDGIALSLSGAFEHVSLDRESRRAEAGGAVALPVLARRAAAAGLAGLEFYVGIPGSVGGALRMNAGGHGRETADVLVGSRLCSLDDGISRDLGPDELRLGYRTSAIRDRDVVVAATFGGHADDPAQCGDRIDEIVRWRREHQPGGQNAGSVFTNPAGDAAGRLIEVAGCKGRRIGGAQVSEKHANFFVADPGATAADVYALVREVQHIVEAETGVHLEPELHLIGFHSEVGR